METKHVFWQSLLHAGAQGAVWILPLIFLAYPQAGDLTLSALGSLIIAYINNRYLTKR